MAPAAVEEGGVPDDNVPHVDKLGEGMALLVHDLLRPLDRLHKLLRAFFFVEQVRRSEGMVDGHERIYSSIWTVKMICNSKHRVDD